MQITADALWAERFPGLAGPADDARLGALRAAAGLVHLADGQPVFRAGQACERYLLVAEGRVRVQLIGEGGREVVLYRVRPGGTCVLTTSCLVGGEHYPAEAWTEGPVQAFALPAAEFHAQLDGCPAFRRFVFDNLGLRLAELLQRMESVLLNPLERRLAAFLLDQPTGPLALTHQALATEVGTAREVVSRHLKRLERAGLVRLGRSQIEVTDRAGLLALLHGRGL
jgi:CRP/FNR family transcriptional regulator